jgi:hypothetical protein
MKGYYHYLLRKNKKKENACRNTRRSAKVVVDSIQGKRGEPKTGQANQMAQ